MWPPMSDLVAFLAAAAASALAALAVKLIDDWLDQDRDRTIGRANLAASLGVGTMVYAALALALAAGINAPLSLALFLASYILGMVSDLGRLFPSRLTGWQESLLVLVAGLALSGWRTMLFAIAFVAAVQLIDDCLDLAADRLAGQRNLACRLGVAECLLLAVTALLAAWWLAPGLFVPVAAGAAVVYLAILRAEGVRT